MNNQSTDVGQEEGAEMVIVVVYCFVQVHVFFNELWITELGECIGVKLLSKINRKSRKILVALMKFN